MAELVTDRVLKLDGIETTTLVAFQAHSKHDLERMFSIGSEEEYLRARAGTGV